MLSERPTMEEMEAFFNGDQFATKAAGCRIVEGWKGHGVAEMELADIHKNAQGNIMGGAIFTLADFALALASNIGGGVIICNYDGKKKYQSTVGPGSFVGSNVNLVSPVNLGENSYIATGSTITEDVPAEALALARARQVNKEEWVARRREKGLL